MGERTVNCPYCTRQFTFSEDLTEITFPNHDIDHCSERANACKVSDKTFQISGETGKCTDCGSDGLFILVSITDGNQVKVLEGHSRNGGKQKVPDGFWRQPWENITASEQLGI